MRIQGDPKPHIVEAFASPEEQTKQMTSILMSILNDRVTTMKEDEDEKSTFRTLLDTVIDLQAKKKKHH